jgi:hypothetical protein
MVRMIAKRNLLQAALAHGGDLVDLPRRIFATAVVEEGQRGTVAGCAAA